MPTTQELRDYASNTYRTNLIESTLVSFDSVNYNISDLLSTTYSSIYEEAILENADGVRSVLLPGSSDPKSMTNTQFIDLIRGARNAQQKIIDIYDSLLNQINALSLTTEGQIDSAHTTSVANYTENREIQNHTITPATTIADAATDAATNAPTNLNVLTTLVGVLTNEVNATNAKQNALAAKYNDLAAKFNTLLAHLETQGLQATS